MFQTYPLTIQKKCDCKPQKRPFFMWQKYVQEPVSQKSRNFTGYFRVSQFYLYPNDWEDFSRQTSQSVSP